MKVAQLHDGSMLHFDDTTPDDAMDNAVQQHMATRAQTTGAGGEMAKALMFGFAQFLQQQHAQAAESQQVDTQNTFGAAGAIANSIEGISRGLSEMTHLGAAIGQLSAHSEEANARLDLIGKQLEKLHRSTSELSSMLMDCTHAIVHALARPKDIIYDEHGSPKRIKVV